MQLKAKRLIYSACTGKGCPLLHLPRWFRFSQKPEDACTYFCTCDLPSPCTLTPCATPTYRRSRTSYAHPDQGASAGCLQCNCRGSISADSPDAAYWEASDQLT